MKGKMTPLVIGQASLLLTLQLLNYVHLYKFEGDRRKFEPEMNRSTPVPHFKRNYLCEKLLPDFNSREYLILTTSWLKTLYESITRREPSGIACTAVEHSELRCESDWNVYSHRYKSQKATGLNRA